MEEKTIENEDAADPYTKFDESKQRRPLKRGLIVFRPVFPTRTKNRTATYAKLVDAKTTD
jgi:hypothetical protein